MSLTTIQIENRTREDLKRFGQKDDTYNEIIKRLMELAERETFCEKQRRILREERFVQLEKV